MRRSFCCSEYEVSPARSLFLRAVHRRRAAGTLRRTESLRSRGLQGLEGRPRQGSEQVHLACRGPGGRKLMWTVSVLCSGAPMTAIGPLVSLAVPVTKTRNSGSSSSSEWVTIRLNPEDTERSSTVIRRLRTGFR